MKPNYGKKKHNLRRCCTCYIKLYSWDAGTPTNSTTDFEAENKNKKS
jgi:hypothetical protein